MSRSSSEEYDPNREEEHVDVDEDGDESILDESSDEGPKRNRKKKAKPGHGKLRAAVHSAQGKSVPEDGMNAKRKASQDQEES